MGIPIRELQDRISSRDFSLYQAYNKIDPIGDVRDDVGVGIVCHTLAQLHGVKGTKVSDFMPDYEAKPKPKKTAEQMFAIAKMFTRAAKGKVN